MQNTLFILLQASSEKNDDHSQRLKYPEDSIVYYYNKKMTI